MKNNYIKMLIVTACLLLSISANAYDFMAGGIYYNITSNQTASVTYKSGFNSYSGNITIPETVTYDNKTYRITEIGPYSFCNCSNPISVNMPNSIIEIGDAAFGGSAGFTSITIPNSVTTFGLHIFERCINLTTMVIGSGVTTISTFSTFNGCTSLKEIMVEVNNPKYASEEGVLFSKDFTTLIKYPSAKSTEYIIPDGVTTIGEYAFLDCINLTDIVISNSVTTISNHAFYGNHSLTSIIIPNSVITIGMYAFSWCLSLTSVKIGSNVKSILEPCFDMCTSLKEFIVEADNKEYSSKDGVLFNKNLSILIRCPEAQSAAYIIPNDVTWIGDYAFSGCCNLSSVIIPNSVTDIGVNGFYGCSDLSSLIIPNSVARIGAYAFGMCTSLNSITIPNSLTEIGDGIFKWCNNINKINSVSAIAPHIEESEVNFFDDNIFAEATLNVPIGASTSYRSANVWKNFVNINEVDFSGVESVNNDEVKFITNGDEIIVNGIDENMLIEVYNLNGQSIYSGTKIVTVPTSGFYIVKIAGKSYKIAVK